MLNNFGLNLSSMVRGNLISVMHDFLWNITNAWHKQLNNPESEVKFFLGGSARFGYANSNSDIDFFVYPVKMPYPNELYHLLYSNGFLLTDEKDHDGYGGELYHNQKYNIHVIVLSDLEEWESLKKKHELVDDYVTKHPDILKFIKTMKGKNVQIKGKYIFHVLYELANSNS